MKVAPACVQLGPTEAMAKDRDLSIGELKIKYSHLYNVAADGRQTLSWERLWNKTNDEYGDFARVTGGPAGGRAARTQRSAGWAAWSTSYAAYGQRPTGLVDHSGAMARTPGRLVTAAKVAAPASDASPRTHHGVLENGATPKDATPLPKTRPAPIDVSHKRETIGRLTGLNMNESRVGAAADIGKRFPLPTIAAKMTRIGTGQTLLGLQARYAHLRTIKYLPGRRVLPPIGLKEQQC